MAVKLKKLMGEAGAGIDESHGTDRLYDVLEALVDAQNAMVTSHNQLLADYNAETAADHVTSTAVVVVPGVEVE